MAEGLTLKWGTLKGWKFDKDSPASLAFKRYCDEPTSMSAMAQHDTPTQKQAIIDIIDALDAETVYLDWDGEHVSKEKAKRYILEYGVS